MSNHSILKHYFDLKKQIQEIECTLKEIEVSATQQALDIITQTGNKQIKFDNTEGKIVVAFNNKYCKPENDAVLTRLEQEINQELRMLAETYHLELKELIVKIDGLKNEILKLEIKQSELMSSEKLTQLQENFKSRYDSLVYAVPILRVHVT